MIYMDDKVVILVFFVIFSIWSCFILYFSVENVKRKMDKVYEFEYGIDLDSNGSVTSVFCIDW